MTNYKLHSIEDAQLASALKAAALNLRIPIEDREINFLLKTQSRDFLLLTKFLKKIDSYSMESKRKITIPLIKELI
jgi:DnaA family protein